MKYCEYLNEAQSLVDINKKTDNIAYQEVKKMLELADYYELSSNAFNLWIKNKVMNIKNDIALLKSTANIDRRLELEKIAELLSYINYIVNYPPLKL